MKEELWWGGGHRSLNRRCFDSFLSFRLFFPFLFVSLSSLHAFETLLLSVALYLTI